MACENPDCLETEGTLEATRNYALVPAPQEEGGGGARGSVVVKALCCKPEGRRFKS
jgi:hypothetical protein